MSRPGPIAVLLALLSLLLVGCAAPPSPTAKQPAYGEWQPTDERLPDGLASFFAHHNATVISTWRRNDELLAILDLALPVTLREGWAANVTLSDNRVAVVEIERIDGRSAIAVITFGRRGDAPEPAPIAPDNRRA